MTTSAFMDLTDEWGMALLVRRDQVEIVREVQGTDGEPRAALCLKSGAMIPVKTKFSTVADLLEGK